MAPMPWPFTTNNCWSAATQSALICTVHVPSPSVQAAANASIYAALASSSRRYAVTVLTDRIVAPRAHTIAIRNYPKGWTCLDRGHHRAQLHSGRAALYRCSAARKTIKKGANKKNSSAAAAYRRGAREQAAPRATDRPPGATPRGPGRSGFPATSQRGSEVYGPHNPRRLHGRVRRVARVTARGGAVRDEDH